MRTITMAMAIFLVPSFLLAQTNCPAGQETVTTGDYSVTYYGNTTDTGNNTSSWFYCVEGTSAPEISHSVVAFPSCLALAGSASSSAGTWGPTTSDLNPGDGSPSFGNDGSTGIFGLKFDEGVSIGDVGMYYFTLDNIYVEGSAAITMKAAQNTPTVSITGPSQSCECAGNYSIMGNVFNTDIPTGLSSVELKLRDENLDIVDFANTNSNGDYIFENVPTGSYTIDVNELTVPTGAIASSTSTGLPVDLSLSCEPANLDISYRNQIDGVIGDLVWYDYCSADGIPDATEMTLGLEGAKVNIYDGTNAFVASAFTDSYGVYRHDGLAADDYTVEFDLSDINIESFIDEQIAEFIFSNPVCPPAPMKNTGGTGNLLADMTTPSILTDALTAGGSNYGFDFALVEASLEVELSSFEFIVRSDETVELHWTSSSEKDFSGYQVQLRRDDDIDFQDHSFVQSRGDVNIETNYQLDLDNLQSGQYQIRLKMIDADGLITYSQLLELEITSSEFEISSYPNPAINAVTIRLASAREGLLTASLYDELGRKVKNVYSGILDESRSFKVDLGVSDLPNGIYFVRVESGKRTTHASITIAR